MGDSISWFRFDWSRRATKLKSGPRRSREDHQTVELNAVLLRLHRPAARQKLQRLICFGFRTAANLYYLQSGPQNASTGQRSL